MALDELRKWADGRPIAVAHYAQQAAVSAEDCFELCRRAQAAELFSLVGFEVKPSNWLKFYRGKRTALERAWDNYLDALDIPADVESAFEEAHAAWTEQTGKCIVGAKKNREVESRYWDALNQWHYETLGNERDAQFEKLFVENPAFAFAFRLEIPYFLIWGTPVRDTYRAARMGDVASIGRILRYDPITIEDARIRQQKLAVLRLGGEQEKLLKTELESDTSRHISRAKMKALIGANIIKFSEAVEAWLKDLARRTPGMKVGRVRLREPDVRSLFDAVAIDIRGEAYDMDIPEDPNAFSQRLKMAKKFWPDPEPYKK